MAPRLKAMGLMFVELGVIGDFLTEVNVTSPTCTRALDALYRLDIGSQLMDAIERKLNLDSASCSHSLNTHLIRIT